MARLLSLVSALLLSVLAAHSAEPLAWGRPVKGIRMALSYLSAEGLLEITIENTTTKGLLLPLGRLGGRDPFLLVTTAGDKNESAIFTAASLATGRFYPFVVPMLPGSRYVVRRPTYQYRISSVNESLGQFMARHPSLRVELVSDSAPSNLDCFPVGEAWTGTLVSNSVRPE